MSVTHHNDDSLISHRSHFKQEKNLIFIDSRTLKVKLKFSLMFFSEHVARSVSSRIV